MSGRPALLFLACVAAGALLVLAGCANAPVRAREKAVAFGRLSAADRKLVLSGQVHQGLSQDAVYIAWGAPTQVQSPGPVQGPLEGWSYTRTFYGPGGGYFGARRGLIYVPKAGRYVYDTDDFYETPVYIRAFGQVSTDVPYRNALFDHGTLVSFEEKTTVPEPAGGG